MGWDEDGVAAARARVVAIGQPSEGTGREQGRSGTGGGRVRPRSWRRRAAALALVAATAAAPGAPATPASAGGQGAGGPSLTLVGQTGLDGLAGFADLTVHRRTAYVGTEDHDGSCPERGVHVVDLTRPRHPTPIGTVAAHPLTFTEDVAVIHAATPAFRGDLLAVGLQACDDDSFEMEGKAGVELFDVSDPRSPVWLSRLELRVPRLTGVHELTLFQRGGRVYAVLAVPFSELNTRFFPSEWVEGEPRYDVRGDVRIVDVTDPRNPVEVGDWAAGRDGNLAFGSPHFGFIGPPFDCTPPSGGEALCRGDGPAVFAHSVSVDATGSRAYVSYWDAGMVILDIAEPASPVLVGRASSVTDKEGNIQEGNTHSAVPARGNRLAVTTDEDRTPGPWGFARIWDLADPANPHEVGRFATDNALSGRTDGDYSVHNPVVQGHRLYLSHYSDGLRVVDISNPAAPREVAAFLPPVDAPHVHGVAVANGLVVITDSNAGLFVLRHGR